MRYGLGNNYPQEVTFNCKNCFAPIQLGIKKFKEKMIVQGALLTDEIKLDKSKEIHVQNVHPEIPINKEFDSNPFFFQTTIELLRFAEKIDIKGFKKMQMDWAKFSEDWNSILSPLRILSLKSEEEMKRVSNLTLNDLEINFKKWSDLFLSGKWTKQFAAIFNDFDNNKSSEMIAYFKSDLKNWIDKILEICKSYMTCREQFDSTILYQKLEIPIEEKMIAKINWDKMKTVYGDLYELVGDLFIIPTMLNNIQSGRKFDEFMTANFTIDKYIATDKANRGENFKNNTSSSLFLNFYHSWLRNGTHHKNCVFVPDENMIELGVGKGGKNLKKVSIVEYIINCNELFAIGLCLSNIIFKILNDK